MKAILVAVATVSFVLSPLLTRGFSGFDPDAFPIPQVAPPVQPAGYAFGIWGLIYLWLLLHAGFGLFLRASDAGWDAGRWPLFVSLGVGTGWIAVANTDPIWATVLIWVMLAGALVSLWFAPHRERWLAQAPIAIYAGWLTAASWVSIGLMLGGYGVTGEVAAAVITLPLAVGFAALVQIMLARAPEYGATVIWALVAVVVANLGDGFFLPALGILGIIVMALAMWRSAWR